MEGPISPTNPNIGSEEGGFSDNNPTTIVPSSVIQSNKIDVKDKMVSSEQPPNLRIVFQTKYPSNFYTKAQNNQTIPEPITDGFPGAHVRRHKLDFLKEGVDIAARKFPGVNPGRSLLYSLRPIAHTTPFSVVSSGLRHDIPTTI